MKVVVLQGGKSREREISLRTGKAVTAALVRLGHQVHVVDPQDTDFLNQILENKPDVAFLALHGRFGEDGSIQGLLQSLEIPYTGSGVMASAICFDKWVTKKMVEKDILTPEYQVFSGSKQDLKAWCEAFSLPFPVIVKPNTEGSTIGIERVYEKSEFLPAMERAIELDSVVLVERYIQGREFTVSVLNGKALPLIEVRPKSGFYDFHSKYTQGQTEYLVPAPIEEEIAKKMQQQSEWVYQMLHCKGAVRVDYMYSDKSYFLEVNTLPGMTETSLLPKAAAAKNISFDSLCAELLKSAL